MKRIGQKETRINIVYEYSIDGCSIFDVLFQIGNSPDIHVRTVTLNDFFSLGNKGHYTPTMRNLCLYENGQAKIRFSRILIQRKKDCEK